MHPGQKGAATRLLGRSPTGSEWSSIVRCARLVTDEVAMATTAGARSRGGGRGEVPWRLMPCTRALEGGCVAWPKRGPATVHVPVAARWPGQMPWRGTLDAGRVKRPQRCAGPGEGCGGACHAVVRGSMRDARAEPAASGSNGGGWGGGIATACRVGFPVQQYALRDTSGPLAQEGASSARHGVLQGPGRFGAAALQGCTLNDSYRSTTVVAALQGCVPYRFYPRL